MGHYASHENYLMAKHMAMQEMEFSESLIHFSEGTVANKKKINVGKLQLWEKQYMCQEHKKKTKAGILILHLGLQK